MIKKLFLALYPLLVIFTPVSVYAENNLADDEFFYSDPDYSNVWINEVMPNPDGSDTDYEWLEIYNDSSEAVDLSDCLVDGKLFPEGVLLGAREFLVITKDLENSADQDGQSFEQRWGDDSGVWGDTEDENYQVVQLSISLKNSDDSVALICGDYENIFEWEISSSGQSLSIDIEGEITDKYLVTPGKNNEPVPPVIYSHTIQISEVYPSPESGENEWIEFYNYGDEDIELAGWIIKDNSKSSLLAGVISSKKHLVFESEDLSITLNNTGETLTLYDPNDEIIDKFSFESTSRSLSNIHKWGNNKYFQKVFQTQSVTKEKRNEYIDPADVFYGCEFISIMDARQLELGSEVCIKGTVTVKLNLLGSKVLYVQDNSGGIQLYLSEETFGSSLNAGNQIRLFGELKETKGEMKIYVSEQRAVNSFSNVDNLQPGVMKTGDIGESVEGQYIMVNGKIVETSGTTFYVDDGSGRIKILVKSSTNINTPKKKKGQYARIVGIVSQYGEDSYRILPRYSSDIVISDTPLSTGQVLAATGGNTSLVQIVIIILFGASILMKRLHKNFSLC